MKRGIHQFMSLTNLSTQESPAELEDVGSIPAVATKKFNCNWDFKFSEQCSIGVIRSVTSPRCAIGVGTSHLPTSYS